MEGFLCLALCSEIRRTFVTTHKQLYIQWPNGYFYIIVTPLTTQKKTFHVTW